MRATLALVVGLIALAGCGGDSGPTKVEAEGAWSGPVTFASGSAGSLAFSLLGTTGSVTGSGTLVGPSESVSLTVTGSYTEPNLSLTMTATGFQPLNLTATVSQSSMTGTLNGSGFLNSAVTLQRQ